MSIGEHLVALITTAALLFGVAAVAKLATPALAVQAVRDALGLHRLARPAVTVVALTELSLAVALVVATGAVSLFLGAALYTAFATFVASSLLSGRTTVSCGCFGQRDVPLSWSHFAIDVAFAVVLLVAGLTWGGAPPIFPPAHAGLAVMSLVAGAVATLLLYAAFTIVPTTERLLRVGHHRARGEGPAHASIPETFKVNYPTTFNVNYPVPKREERSP